MTLGLSSFLKRFYEVFFGKSEIVAPNKKNISSP